MLLGMAALGANVPTVVGAPAPQTTPAPSHRWQLPDDVSQRKRLEQAADWLVQQIHAGTLQNRPEGIPMDHPETPIHVIAWHDPTLAPGAPDQLVGYLLTDTLWAGHALAPFHPKQSRALLETLTRLDASGNGLQEVLFQPLDSIRHRVVDADPVHGTSIGQLAGPVTIDVRRFHFEDDPSFTRDHPRLFAEHRVYQALFDYRQGNRERGKERLRSFFRASKTATAQQPVVWDAERQLLIDAGNFQQWREQPSTVVGQYPIKLGTLIFALRYTGLASDYPTQMKALERRLWQAQHPPESPTAGGLAHFLRVHPDGTIVRGQGATGEATAIGILSEIISPDETLAPQ